MRKIFFDIETTAIKAQHRFVDHIHFVVKQENGVDNEPVIIFDIAREFVPLMESEDVELIGHNIYFFDIPQLLHHYKPDIRAKLTDTLLLSFIGAPFLKAVDYQKNNLPLKKLYGSHSLEAWGYRIGEYKGDFKGPWDKVTPEMLDYAKQDVRVTKKLYELLITSPFYNEQVSDFEHAIHRIFMDIYLRGVPVEGLDALREKIQRDNQQALEEIRKLGFNGNPNSRQQVAKFLIEHMGWEPKEFTEKTNAPKVSGDTLPEGPFKTYYMTQKPLSHVESLIKHLHKDTKRLHPQFLTSSTRTGRTSCRNPNMQQLPSVRKSTGNEKAWELKYGLDFRRVVITEPGHVALGCDMSQLELRGLGQALYTFSGSRFYIDLIESGADVHAENQKLLGLENRTDAKRVVFGTIYGASQRKIASMLGISPREAQMIIHRLRNNVPGFGKMKAVLEHLAQTQGYVELPTGRKLYVQYPHTAVNTWIQGLGALIAKVWMQYIHDNMDKDKARVVLFVHDELYMSAEPSYAKELESIIIDSLQYTKEKLGLEVSLETDIRIGKNWAEVH